MPNNLTINCQLILSKQIFSFSQYWWTVFIKLVFLFTSSMLIYLRLHYLFTCKKLKITYYPKLNLSPQMVTFPSIISVDFIKFNGNRTLITSIDSKFDQMSRNNWWKSDRVIGALKMLPTCISPVWRFFCLWIYVA